MDRIHSCRLRLAVGHVAKIPAACRERRQDAMAAHPGGCNGPRTRISHCTPGKVPNCSLPQPGYQMEVASLGIAGPAPSWAGPCLPSWSLLANIAQQSCFLQRCRLHRTPAGDSLPVRPRLHFAPIAMLLDTHPAVSGTATRGPIDIPPHRPEHYSPLLEADNHSQIHPLSRQYTLLRENRSTQRHLEPFAVLVHSTGRRFEWGSFHAGRGWQ